MHLSILEKTWFPKEKGRLQVFNQLDINDMLLAFATSMTTIKYFFPFPGTDTLYFSQS